MFDDRECISHDLTWMVEVCQTIDHRDCGIFSKIKNVLKNKRSKVKYIVKTLEFQCRTISNIRAVQCMAGVVKFKNQTTRT